MSTKSAGLATKMGYTNIRVMLEGEPGWAKAGYPTYASKEFIKTGNIILIDLRKPSLFKDGHIQRAVSIPFATLDDRLDDIPKKAPVVFYSDKVRESEAALNKLRGEKYKSVSLVPGNISEWVRSKESLVRGDVVTEITWKRILGKGEVSTGDFMSAAEKKGGDTIILDVRTNDEVKDGVFAGAKHIPLDELTTRSGELPKDKNIFIYCNTGARADMAYQELAKSGFKVKFLVADVECEDGECEID